MSDLFLMIGLPLFMGCIVAMLAEATGGADRSHHFLTGIVSGLLGLGVMFALKQFHIVTFDESGLVIVGFVLGWFGWMGYNLVFRTRS